MYSQNNGLSVEYGRTSITSEQNFSITIKSNSKISSWGDFPDITGFTKGKVQPNEGAHFVITNQGFQRKITYTLTQYYHPTSIGSFELKPYNLKINNKTYGIKDGVKITVREVVSRYEDLDFVEMNDNSFLSLSANKKEVYTGESVNISFVFYIRYEDVQTIQFTEDASKQIGDALDKLDFKNSWLEQLDIQTAQQERVKINNKNYIKITLSEYLIYPNSETDLKFPALTVYMNKTKVSKQVDNRGQQYYQKSKKPYKTRPLTIKVKSLPPHPLRNTVAVGNYELTEKVDKLEFETGGAVEYKFKIHGYGNLHLVPEPEVSRTDSLTFFKPSTKQKIEIKNKQLQGYKQFSYNIVAELPGVYNLSNSFNWVYFNPIEEKYDTLKPKLLIHAIGESLSQIDMEDDNLLDFYDRLETADKKLVFLNQPDYQRWAINLFGLALIAVVGYTYYKKRNG